MCEAFFIFAKNISILKYLIKVLDFLIYGNFFIALCAAAQAYQTLYLRHYSVDGNPHIIFIFSATFFLYNIHKAITFYLKKDILEYNAPIQHAQNRFLKAKAFETPISILTFTAGMVSLETYLRFYIDTQCLIASVGALCMLYVLPIFKGKRLRDIPYLKIFLIAGVWAFVTVTFPLKAFAKEWYSCDTFMIIEKIFFILAITIPFDIRDMVLDASTGVKTIPLSIGTKNSKWLAYGLLTMSFLTALFINLMSVYTLNTLIAIGISLAISAFVIHKTNNKRSDYFYYFFVDGLLLLQTILVLLISFEF